MHGYKMGKIFYIMGKSSSGKDTIYKSIIEHSDLNLKTVVLYTTRPIRDGEIHGVEYFFTNEETLEQIRQSGNLIELRGYDTIHGVWKYFTVNDNQINLAASNYIIIGTLVSYQKLKDYFGEQHLVPVYIEVDDGIRLQRALDRERAQDVPKYAELCRRFLADDQDFSEENLIKAGITQRFNNKDLKSCLEQIVSYIKADCDH